MFMGEYHHNIDEKSRIIMPSKFRYDLGETFVITRGIDSCLFVYPKETWNNITNKLNELLNEYEIYQKTHNLDEARIVYMTKDELLKLNPDIKNKITN